MSDRGGIDALLDLMDEAFRGRGIEDSNESQALLTNLATVPATAWTSSPEGAVRSVADIALHVGACKVMYDDYAFGAGTLEFGTPDVEPWSTATVGTGRGHHLAGDHPRKADRPRRRPRLGCRAGPSETDESG